MDLSFPVYQEVNGAVIATQVSVNDTTVLQAPSIPVKEIGKVFPWLLHYMGDTPAGLHILFSKLNISDGFWCLIVQEADCFNFAYVLSHKPRERYVELWYLPQSKWAGWKAHLCSARSQSLQETSPSTLPTTTLRSPLTPLKSQ